MSVSIEPAVLLREIDQVAVIDVRKEPARRASGTTIPGAIHRKPFLAEEWWPEFSGRRVVVFCVHGQEVSRAVRGFLSDNGIDARFLEGGLEEWRSAGLPLVAIS